MTIAKDIFSSCVRFIGFKYCIKVLFIVLWWGKELHEKRLCCNGYGFEPSK
jgi:hypothetical protein